jgi:hypothetical protein
MLTINRIGAAVLIRLASRREMGAAGAAAVVSICLTLAIAAGADVVRRHRRRARAAEFATARGSAGVSPPVLVTAITRIHNDQINATRVT